MISRPSVKLAPSVVHRCSTEGRAIRRRTLSTVTTRSEPDRDSAMSPRSTNGNGSESRYQPSAPLTSMAGPASGDGQRVDRAREFAVHALGHFDQLLDADRFLGPLQHPADRQALERLLDVGHRLPLALPLPAQELAADAAGQQPVDGDRLDPEAVQGQRGEQPPGLGDHHPFRA